MVDDSFRDQIDLLRQAVMGTRNGLSHVVQPAYLEKISGPIAIVSPFFFLQNFRL